MQDGAPASCQVYILRTYVYGPQIDPCGGMALQSPRTVLSLIQNGSIFAAYPYFIAAPADAIQPYAFYRQVVRLPLAVFDAMPYRSCLAYGPGSACCIYI